MTGLFNQIGKRVDGSAASFAYLLFCVVMTGVVYFVGYRALAIYALSFWHYYLYWLAYRYGAASLRVFKRDAILMKSVSLLVLGVAYIAAPLDLLSLVVVSAGFALNIISARVLGADRTYYGHELAGLPHRQISSFPYSWISHPMLVGNMAAFAGTLLNDEFRQQWWPLACLHVALNFALLVMEQVVTPLRRGSGNAPSGNKAAGARPNSIRTAGLGIAGGAALGGALGGLGSWAMERGTLIGAGIGASVAMHAIAIFLCYSIPAPDKSGELKMEDSP
ncbi:MAG: methyltransferase [Burkholderiales bacterium]